MKLENILFKLKELYSNIKIILFKVCKIKLKN